ncbi:MAG: nucleotidyltransferase domain-containing protein [Nanoarchaeota archaeon]
MDKRVMRELISVKKKYNPERMIVFGSTARGDTHEGSDVDVILIKDTKKRFTDRIGEVMEMWKGEQPIEPLVYTQEEFKEKEKTSDFIRTAIKEGIEI